jgi:hypothetical protein
LSDCIDDQKALERHLKTVRVHSNIEFIESINFIAVTGILFMRQKNDAVVAEQMKETLRVDVFKLEQN